MHPARKFSWGTLLTAALLAAFAAVGPSPGQAPGEGPAAPPQPAVAVPQGLHAALNPATLQEAQSFVQKAAQAQQDLDAWQPLAADALALLQAPPAPAEVAAWAAKVTAWIDHVPNEKVRQQARATLQAQLRPADGPPVTEPRKVQAIHAGQLSQTLVDLANAAAQPLAAVLQEKPPTLQPLLDQLDPLDPPAGLEVRPVAEVINLVTAYRQALPLALQPLAKAVEDARALEVDLPRMTQQAVTIGGVTFQLKPAAEKRTVALFDPQANLGVVVTLGAPEVQVEATGLYFQPDRSPAWDKVELVTPPEDVLAKLQPRVAAQLAPGLDPAAVRLANPEWLGLPARTDGQPPAAFRCQATLTLAGHLPPLDVQGGITVNAAGNVERPGGPDAALVGEPAANDSAVTLANGLAVSAFRLTWVPETRGGQFVGTIRPDQGSPGGLEARLEGAYQLPEAVVKGRAALAVGQKRLGDLAEAAWSDAGLTGRLVLAETAGTPVLRGDLDSRTDRRGLVADGQVTLFGALTATGRMRWPFGGQGTFRAQGSIQINDLRGFGVVDAALTDPAQAAVTAVLVVPVAVPTASLVGFATVLVDGPANGGWRVQAQVQGIAVDFTVADLTALTRDRLTQVLEARAQELAAAVPVVIPGEPPGAQVWTVWLQTQQQSPNFAVLQQWAALFQKLLDQLNKWVLFKPSGPLGPAFQVWLGKPVIKFAPPDEVRITFVLNVATLPGPAGPGQPPAKPKVKFGQVVLALKGLLSPTPQFVIQLPADLPEDQAAAIKLGLLPTLAALFPNVPVDGKKPGDAKALVQVPGLVGQPAAAAEALLTQKGMRARWVQQVQAGDLVFDQGLEPGATVLPGTEVALLPGVAVPAVENLNLADAQRALAERGLTPVMLPAGVQFQPDDRVFTQTPTAAAGKGQPTLLPHGEPVALTVRVKVPALKGQTLLAAATQLASRKLEAKFPDQSGQDSKVAGQRPDPGLPGEAFAAPGTQVKLLLKVRVPDVTRRPKADAEAALAQAPLALRWLTKPQATDLVFRQQPAAGAEVDPDTTVSLTPGVPVPAVKGMPLAQARAALGAVGLKPDLRPALPYIDRDQVGTQQPPAAGQDGKPTLLPRGAAVTLGMLVAVPAVKDRPLKEARALLTQRGLRAQAAALAPDKGLVTGQAPAAETLVPPFSTVALQTQVVVPPLVRLPAATAETALRQAGLRARWAVAAQAGDLVMVQEPAAGTAVATQAEVALLPGVPVPDVLGDLNAAAVKKLAAVGLVADYAIPVAYHDEDRVFEQKPLAADATGQPTLRPRGERVRLNMMVKVPHLVGKPLLEAVKELNEHWLGARFPDETDQNAKVKLQNPDPTKPGQAYQKPGTAVTLRLDAVVPDVVGRTVAEAEKLIAEAGLAFEWVNGPPRPGEYVYDQNPAAGQTVNVNTAVFLMPGVPVPDVVGQAHPEAVAAIKKAGLVVDYFYRLTYHDQDKVFTQKVAPAPKGQKPPLVPRGATVQLKMAVRVPEVVGKPLLEAVKEVNASYLGAVFPPETEEDARVVLQAPDPRKGGGYLVLGPDAKVTLTVQKFVPDVLGLPREKAEAALTLAGLRWVWRPQVLQGDRVAEQQPPGGTAIDPERPQVVDLAPGVPVPLVEGKYWKDAAQDLATVRLNPRPQPAGEYQAEDKVQHQNPRPRDAKGKEVILSRRGPLEVILDMVVRVPKVLKQPLRTAKRTITDHRLTPDVPAGADANGTVNHQDPSEGVYVAPQTRVTVRVETTVRVPNVTHLPRPRAEGILREKGLRFAWGPDAQAEDYVWAQTPKAGEAIDPERGTVVLEPAVAVPDVERQPWADAQRAIVRVGLTPVPLPGNRRPQAEDHVYLQRPAARDERGFPTLIPRAKGRANVELELAVRVGDYVGKPIGEAMNLVKQIGLVPRRIEEKDKPYWNASQEAPNVEGSRPRDAEFRLNQAGVPFQWRPAFQAETDVVLKQEGKAAPAFAQGTVAKQRPEPGAFLPPGDKVFLTPEYPASVVKITLVPGFQVPSVVGYTLEEAREYLSRVGLTANVGRQQDKPVSTTCPHFGKVEVTHQSATGLIPRGTTAIMLDVVRYVEAPTTPTEPTPSTGPSPGPGPEPVPVNPERPEYVIVPHCLTMAQRAAEGTLRLKQLVHVYHATGRLAQSGQGGPNALVRPQGGHPAGGIPVVVRMDPPAGTRVKVGTEVHCYYDLQESNTVAVPHLQGLTRAQAQAKLAETGLREGGVINNASGTVSSSLPPAGTMVPRGSAVNVVFAGGAKPAYPAGGKPAMDTPPHGGDYHMWPARPGGNYSAPPAGIPKLPGR